MILVVNDHYFKQAEILALKKGDDFGRTTFFIQGLVLRFWLQQYHLLRPQFQTSCNFNPQKRVILGVPLFNLGIVFKVLAKIVPMVKAMILNKFYF